MLSISPGIQVDLFAELAKLAHEEICKITGEITTEDVLGKYFQNFVSVSKKTLKCFT